jgi:RNA polymerase sigma factor for flagellar operon FliA
MAPVARHSRVVGGGPTAPGRAGSLAPSRVHRTHPPARSRTVHFSGHQPNWAGIRGGARVRTARPSVAHALRWGSAMKTQTTTQRQLERQALALIPAVRRMARALGRSLPKHVSVDDLIGAGNLGLTQALRAYEPREGVAFEAYALCRARGAMLDELREIDPLTRRQRKALSNVDRSTQRLRTELEREPTSEEVASACEMTIEEYSRVTSAARRRQAVSLDSGSGRESQAPPDPAADGMDAEALTLALHDSTRIASALNRLPDRMRQVLVLSFEEEKKLREVAETLGVSQTRVHQLREEAVDRLQKSYLSFSIVPAKSQDRRKVAKAPAAHGPTKKAASGVEVW